MFKGIVTRLTERFVWLMHWRVLLLVFCLGVSSGVYSHTVWLGYLENEADKKHNEWFNKNSEGLEVKRAETKRNERDVIYAKKRVADDSYVTSIDRLRVLNAALTNDTSKLKE